MTLAYFSHPACGEHDMGANHPEQPARLAAIETQLCDSGLMDALLRLNPHPVADALVDAAHSRAYREQLERLSPASGRLALDPDTHMNPHSLAAARLAAGAAVRAVDVVMSGDARQAFCAVRPPGHHAERERAMGFCIFNNVAIAALHALNAYSLKRVAIVDFDVHHGNGTQDIVAGDQRILFCSSYQHPLYPNSGNECSAANVVNCPLPAGTGSAAFQHAISTQWLPRIDAFRPELLLVSAGFDAHIADPLADLALADSDYAWLGDTLSQAAARWAKGRMISTLEGGYDLKALASSVEAYLRACLQGASAPA